MKRMVSLCVIAVMMVAVIGCGGKKVNVWKTSGTILMDGKPVSGARVTLHLEGEGASRKPGGTTDDDGKVEIMYPGNEGEVSGAPPGEYTVTVRKTKANSDADPSDEDAQAAMKAYEEKMKKSMSKKSGNQMTKKKPKDDTKGEGLVPDGYQSRVQSPFKITVTESDDNTFELKLDSKFKGKVQNQ